jgi:predicted AAA+ superfamily ATPase
MPHTRKRHIQSIFEKVCAHSPLTGIVGHRQVGKTTFLENNTNSYFTLDSKSERTAASENAEKYIKERAGHHVGVDECQLEPELFPAFKEWIRIHKKPGQFILSGSVRFTSREAIRESLTGRIMNLELLPFSLAEIEEDPLPTFCFDALNSPSLSHFVHQRKISIPKIKAIHGKINKYFSHGGLPGICFIRDQKLRISKIEEQLLTILDRDLRLVKKISVPYNDLLNLTKALAQTQGAPLTYTNLRQKVGISIPTIKKILFALEAVFVLRTVPIEGSTQGTCVYFEDQGEGSYLANREDDLLFTLSHFAFTNVRPQFEYRLGERVQPFQYRTRGGALVPLAFRGKNGILGILPIRSSEEFEGTMGTINSFLGTYGEAKLLVVHPDAAEIKVIRPRVLSVPMAYLTI